MGTVQTVRQFDQIGERFPWLRYRVALVFPRGEGPKNAQGTLRRKAPAGAKFSKFNLPPVGVRLGEGTYRLARYPVPESVQNAPFGELVLGRRKDCLVYFGRFGEDRAFTFNIAERKDYIFLRIYRAEDVEFKTLYMRVDVGEEFRYFLLNVEWRDDVIAVSVLPTKESDAPDFLQASVPRLSSRPW